MRDHQSHVGNGKLHCPRERPWPTDKNNPKKLRILKQAVISKEMLEKRMFFWLQDAFFVRTYRCNTNRYNFAKG